MQTTVEPGDFRALVHACASIYLDGREEGRKRKKKNQKNIIIYDYYFYDNNSKL